MCQATFKHHGDSRYGLPETCCSTAALTKAKAQKFPEVRGHITNAGASLACSWWQRSAIRCRGQMGGAWRESEGAGPEGLRGPVSGSQAKELKGPGRKPLGVSSFLLSSEKGGMRTSKKVPLGLSRRYEPLWERNTTTGSVRARTPAPAVLPRPTPPPALWLGSTAPRDGR